MIIPEQSAKSSAAAYDAESIPQTELPPPAYEAAEVSSHSSAPLSRPSNYIMISKTYGAIKDNFTINLALQELTSFLPELGPNETRKNLLLHTTHGSIKANVALVPVDSTITDRATLSVESDYASVSTSIHRSLPTPVFHLSATAQAGSVNVKIPRSFCGLVKLRSQYSCVRFSDQVLAKRALLSDVGGTLQGFVGDIPATGLRDINPEYWKGDTLIADSTHGSVHVQYDDEEDESFFTSLKKNFWGAISSQSSTSPPQASSPTFGGTSKSPQSQESRVGPLGAALGRLAAPGINLRPVGRAAQRQPANVLLYPVPQLLRSRADARLPQDNRSKAVPQGSDVDQNYHQ